MKIEKINNNKIRCYLDSNDLSARQIDLKELTYGSEKAKKLFYEMFEEASAEFGLEFEDSPIMVEAIPLVDSIILNISKVEDPEELDTRFSRFTPDSEDSDTYEQLASLIPQLLEGFEEQTNNTVADTEPEETVDCEKDSTRIFKFRTLDNISNAARALSFTHDTMSTVYFNSLDNHYYLVTSMGDLAKENYVKVCNTLSEFGKRIHGDNATAAYYEEHLECIIKEQALDICRKL